MKIIPRSVRKIIDFCFLPSCIFAWEMRDAVHLSFDEMTQPEMTGQLILDLFKIVVRCLNRPAVLCTAFFV